MSPSLKIGLGIAVLLCTAGAWFALSGGATSPAAQEMVWDEAGLLDREQKDFISEYHRVLLTDFDTDLRVLTLPGKVDAARSATDAFTKRKVGSLSSTGRGLLLVIAKDSNVVRLEVSEALEPVITDAFTAYVEQRQMVPFFRSNRVADGILATTELIYTRAADAQRGEAFDPRKLDASSSGAGAQTAAAIGQGYDMRPLQQRGGTVNAGQDPLQTVAAYIQAMRNRDARPDLPIYTKATRNMLAGWTVTAGQMDSVSRTYAACGPASLHVIPGQPLAVARYPAKARTCSPWFLTLEDGAWRLDLTTMQRVIRFNNRNQWHFVSGTRHAYEPAFADWLLDEHGFPHERRR